MDRTEEPGTLQEAVKFFANPDTCFEFTKAVRWPDGVVKCPICGSAEVYFLAHQKRWECRNKHPRRQFSVKVGSIFEDSPLGLDKWWVAVWLLTSCKNGVSSYELHRALGITQKTAWLMLHRVRLALQRGSFDKFGGEVEADETYIGGKARFMSKARKARKIKGRGMMGKIAVFGLLERHGKGDDRVSRVRTKVLGDATQANQTNLHGNVRAHVKRGSELFTDDAGGYCGLESDYVHKVINHAEEYVKGNVHTQGIDNYWSLLKRGLRGTYVSVEPFHLFRYLGEEAFRFNERKNEDGDRGRFMEAASGVFGKRLMYKQLIGEAPATT